ncbi:hypothetical protein LPJ66_004721 [Kickxella alabastrina]|uniref:Uncharacterized protein n=1 Tax=Kickxella alabastrina TaxID=61397 RepID=A0ACC1IIV2_9FUNG|nr:hypothetical protein LPJ66_004721 [Kickxella alabastrina]
MYARFLSALRRTQHSRIDITAKGTAGARQYSEESMLKGTPKFTRMQPKSAVRRRAQPTPDGTGEPDWGSSGRAELNSKSISRLAFIGGATAAGVGLMGVAAYYGGTYFYLRNNWAASEDIDSSTARNLLYLATYYERLSPNYKRALDALEKALEIIDKDAKLPRDSLAVLEIRVRIAECLFNMGDESSAASLARQILPDFDRKGDSRKSESAVDNLKYILATVLGQACANAGRSDDAAAAYSIGLQAVKRMKQGMVAKFDGENLAEYTEYDNLNLKEALLTSRLAESFFAKGDHAVSETLFQGVLASIKQHRAHLDVAPHIVQDYRTFKDEWACLDAHAMLHLAKIQTDAGNIDAAIPWIESARTVATEKRTFNLPKCVDCIAGILSELGRIAEIQGDSKKALRRYREAYEHARLNFSDYQQKLAADVERLEQNV